MPMMVNKFILLYSMIMIKGPVWSPPRIPPFKSSLPPPPESPIAAASEDQKEHNDEKYEAHGFLLNI